MNGRHVVLDQVAGRGAAALLIDGQLEDLLIDAPAGGPPAPGTIFRARVDRPVKGQGGVFVALPEGASGFLRQVKGLKQGQSVLAQVTGYAEPGKAVPLTDRVLFKSKYAIVTPGAPGLNISRQIRAPERRDALHALAERVAPAADYGAILRSDAAHGEDAAVADDLAEMLRLCQTICADIQGPPERLLDGPDAQLLAWRDWGHPDRLDDAPGSFDSEGVLDALLALRGPDTTLPGGASMAIEPTRALIAVDINTQGDTSPAAGVKANLAAARSLPRALRVRGLGGQITLDLAPMPKKDRRGFEEALRAAFRSDLIETALVGWTPLGHFEAQRKRERLPLDPKVLEAL